MNKTALKNFSVWARNKLIEDITYRAGLVGVSASGIASPLPQSTKDLQFFDIGTKEYAQVSGGAIGQRDALVAAIRSKERDSDYGTAFAAVVEEIAYTWFNRLVAIRFMEVNDYLPSRIRVLSSENPAKNEPDLVTTPFDGDLEFTIAEQDKIMQLKDENKLDELFRFLFVKQCNKLYEILPVMFEKTSDYTELLLSIPFTDKDGIVYRLTHIDGITDADWRDQVQIIGWLYQYYISEKHDQIINIHKGTIKKEDIPAATQLFTTDWVVRYMVDNSLGRYWIERNPESRLAEKLEYFVTPKDGKINYINEKVLPQDLTFFDPCLGSGHILVYAFDVLMEIYRECGYSDREAALNIVQNNLFGLDIDKRAYQLAYFAVMMKARSYNRRALTQGIWNNISAIEESNELNGFNCQGVTTDKAQNQVGEYLIDVFRHAREIGSLQTVEKKDYKSFAEYLLNLSSPNAQLDLFSTNWITNNVPVMLELTKQAAIMSNKYAVVCTNPPYMNKLESHLKDFVVKNYKAYSGDLFSVFMYRNFGYCKPNGYSAFMTPFVWMFIKTYEPLRNYILDTKSITTLVQMEYSAFEEATVPICSFVLQNGKTENKFLCFRLSDFKGGMEIQKQKVLEAQADKDCGYFYESTQDNFSQIPGSPIAYWLSERMLSIYKGGTIKKAIDMKQGTTFGNNDLFLRLWFEVNYTASKKWFPCLKGGSFRRWFGNAMHLVNWEENGRDIKNSGRATIRSESYFFRDCITCSHITSGAASFRYAPPGSIFESASVVGFPKAKESLKLILGFLNSKISKKLLFAINPSIALQSGDVAKLPFISIDKSDELSVDRIVEYCINISKNDWDSFETSWDFKRHPLIPTIRGVWDIDEIENETQELPQRLLIEASYEAWAEECEDRFHQLKANEEELNRIFIDTYGLQDELTPEVEDKDVTVRKADLTRDIKSFISYAVGCMFGRYSLSQDGLAYAGGEWDDKKYSAFKPDQDNCIPITDEPYFEDDIVSRFCEFLKVVYGEDCLEANLDFIAKALGNKGATSREIIRNYFLNDFMKDHMKIYQKRPIYWLFDSGKQNGFKALVYMHRWNADTVGNLRVEYLHKTQHVYEREIQRMQDTIDEGRDSREVSKATKRKDKLQKQLKETKDYDAMLAHIALSRIEIDLDDGVKVNYEKVQTARDGKKMQILAKI